MQDLVVTIVTPKCIPLWYYTIRHLFFLSSFCLFVIICSMPGPVSVSTNNAHYQLFVRELFVTPEKIDDHLRISKVQVILTHQSRLNSFVSNTSVVQFGYPEVWRLVCEFNGRKDSACITLHPQHYTVAYAYIAVLMQYFSRKSSQPPKPQTFPKDRHMPCIFVKNTFYSV